MVRRQLEDRADAQLEEIGGEGWGDGRKLDDLGFWSGRMCNISIQGRSLWGPRYDPMRSSLLTIMKPNVFGDVDPSIKTKAYTLRGRCTNPPIGQLLGQSPR